MVEIRQLVSDIKADAELNDSDIRVMRLLLKVAEGRHSRAECGELWLKTCSGDLARTKEELKHLQTRMNEMLLQWYVGAVVASREPKEMK